MVYRDVEERKVDIDNPPDITIKHIEDVDGPPFLTLRHLKIKLEYPDGTESEEFIHDVVNRGKLDAVIICAFEIRENKPYIWLRSCVRPAIASRFPFPNSMGNGWELPAGLVDAGEKPEEAAVRELQEEVGFYVEEVAELGRPVWGAVGLAPERLHFYAVNVTNFKRLDPVEDGSELERGGQCICVPFEDALKVGDMKTDLGILRLKEFFAPVERAKFLTNILEKVAESLQGSVDESDTVE
jgi:8-oxo-dGTP pyrophosphatase MutT (NUDIX family)